MATDTVLGITGVKFGPISFLNFSFKIFFQGASFRVNSIVLGNNWCQIWSDFIFEFFIRFYFSRRIFQGRSDVYDCGEPSVQGRSEIDPMSTRNVFEFKVHLFVFPFCFFSFFFYLSSFFGILRILGPFKIFVQGASFRITATASASRSKNNWRF